jgi:hypothetical protein
MIYAWTGATTRELRPRAWAACLLIVILALSIALTLAVGVS